MGVGWCLTHRVKGHVEVGGAGKSTGSLYYFREKFGNERTAPPTPFIFVVDGWVETPAEKARKLNNDVDLGGNEWWLENW